MTKHVVCRAEDIPPGSRKLVQAGPRSIVIFNLDGDFFGLLNRCPHQGGTLADGTTTGLLEADTPGEYRYTRQGEILRCPWHGWEFDIRTGLSRCHPDRIKARAFEVSVELRAETVPVEVEREYLIVDS